MIKYILKLIFILIVLSIKRIGQKQLVGRIVDYDTKKAIKNAMVSVGGKDAKASTNFSRVLSNCG